MMRIAKQTKVTSSAKITDGPAILFGVLVGTDETNDAVVTVFASTSNAGTEAMPTTKFDASALGLNGFTLGYGKSCPAGIYVEITCAGTCEVTVDYIQNES